ncbi:oocyte zinc finger protein XlCOF6-like [Cloeon dipterum]|uniref:oocyte zinc finger protein XlCOF6-like n=1 Tax=Cloeon dipterum TaxID=197152 RepID=UPI0032207641
MQPITKGKSGIQKPLCRLCDCPTSDGYVLASQVDRFKLRRWAMKVLDMPATDGNLPMLIGEDHLICYFCLWKAEFADESGDESVAWWPKNLDLEENTQILKENYAAGDVEQCWVQLEEIDLEEYTNKESPEKREFDIDQAKYVKKITNKRNNNGECIYCGKKYNELNKHVKYMHKDAIRCGIRGCGTYFYSEEDKKQHMQQVSHKKRNKPREKIPCKFCKNITLFSTLKLWRRHMIHDHPEFPVRCSRVGCREYFKSKSEMILHFNSSFKRTINQEYCEYYTSVDSHLRKNEEARLSQKIFKCDSCDAEFGSKLILETHYKECHTLNKCKSCGQDVALGSHRKPTFCSKCKLKFKKRLRKKSCKQTIFSREERGKSFRRRMLKCHEETNFRCFHCDFSSSDKSNLTTHMQRRHFPKTIKCEECDKLFSCESILKLHKNSWHEYVDCSECDQEVRRQNVQEHLRVKTCHRCKRNFRCSGLYQLHRKSCKQTLFTCKECGKTFEMCCKLKVHVQTVHTKSVKTKIFLCNHCVYSTFDKRCLHQHMQRKHLPKTIKCVECNKLFSSESILKLHKFRHHDLVHCAECAQEIRRYSMINHRQVKICQRCKCKFRCSGLYQLHERSCKQPPFSCKDSGTSSTTSQELKRHVRNSHTNTAKTKIFLCHHCDYSTFEKGHMMEHMQRRHLPKRFKCEECNTLYASDMLLRLHKFRYHELVHCAECAQEISRDAMFDHRQAKTCLRCQCKFRCLGLYQLHRKSCKQSSGNTSRHVQTVNNTEIFLCADCGYSTFHKSHMSEHTQQNHLSKTIKCEEC